ncbi:MAG TPA: NAD(P)-dependent oxidoreductase [Acetobacteraceae bacterium]|nr:NAD(P)-dependent oxidoreductase [Acetobacteraceae bacterium]
MTRTVLITGAAGNIGTKLRAHFSALGWRLRVLDADPGSDTTIQAADLARWDDAWVAQFADVDTVIHLAGDPNSGASWASAQQLNIDLTANVYEAAAAQRVRRVVFASSNWVMAGHRSGNGRLTTDMEPYPVNPYGVSKLVGERMGRSIHARRGVSVICFRIGYVQQGDNRPGPHMGWSAWGQAMWLSNRDLCQAMERAVLAEGVGFAVLNLMSDNPGMRWDIETTKRVIGYAPSDGAKAVLTAQIERDARTADDVQHMIERLQALLRERRW